MNIVVLKSVRNSYKKDPYSISIDTLYAQRVLDHLSNKPGYCTACGKKCIGCKRDSTLDFSDHIREVFDFPAVVPAILDEPEALLPEFVPPHDVLISLGINEEILLSFIHTFPFAKGIIIPIERSDWLSPNAQGEISKLGQLKNIEVSFPKPFCSFNPSEGILRDFKTIFKIGKPEVRYSVQKNTITAIDVVSSAPCGATYFTVKGLINKKIDSNLTYIIDKQLSCYPCTADTAVDKDFNDSIIHQAVKIQRHMLHCLPDSV